MRARMRRLHHSISPSPVGAVTALEYLAFGFERASAMSTSLEAKRELSAQFGGGDRSRGIPSSRARIGSGVVRSTSRRSVATQNSVCRRARHRDARPAGVEFVEPRLPFRRRAGARMKRQQRVVQFVGIAQVGPRLRPTPASMAAGSRMPAPSATSVRRVRRNCTARARRSSSGASSRIRVRVRVEDFVREDARARALSIATVRIVAVFDAFEDRASGHRDPSPRAGSCRWFR